MGWIADLLQEIPSAARYKIQLEQMATENAELKSKVATLESKLLAAEEKIRHQDETIKKQSPDIHDEPLEKLKVDILLFLSEQRARVTADEVASHRQINPQIALHHLTELSKKNMVLTSRAVNSPPFWRLGDEGRAYLINNNLIS
jgi:hypothetical protein